MGLFTIEEITIDDVEQIVNERAAQGLLIHGIIRPEGYLNVPLLENLANSEISSHAYFVGKIDGQFVALSAMGKFFDPLTERTKIIHRMNYVLPEYHTKNIGPAMMKRKSEYCEANNWNDDDDTVHFSYLMTGNADDFLSISGWDPYTVENFNGRDFIGFKTTWGEYKLMPTQLVDI